MESHRNELDLHAFPNNFVYTLESETYEWLILYWLSTGIYDLHVCQHTSVHNLWEGVPCALQKERKKKRSHFHTHQMHVWGLAVFSCYCCPVHQTHNLASKIPDLKNPFWQVGMYFTTNLRHVNLSTRLAMWTNRAALTKQGHSNISSHTFIQHEWR